MIGLLVVGGALAAYFLRGSSTAPAKVTQISHWNKPIVDPTLSPDGHAVAFTSSVEGFNQVFVMLASGGEPLQLTNNSVDKQVEGFSPDGTQIYYSNDFTGNESFSVPTLGGAPSIVAPGFSLAQSSDSEVFYYIKTRINTVFRKPRTGASEESVFRSPEGMTPVKILPFPDGKELLIVVGNDTVQGSTSVGLYRVNLDTHASQKISDISGTPTGLVWSTRARACFAAAL